MLGPGMGFCQGQVRRADRRKVVPDGAGGARHLDDRGRHPVVFVTIYFVTIVAVVGTFNAWMLVPFIPFRMHVR